jgi:protein O-mannosyl-transferase
VAWIPGRNDSLLAVFSLASWLCLLRAWEPGRWGSRIGHFGLWLCALLCKETAVVLPVVCVAHLLLVEQKSWRALLAPWLLAGWAAALAIYLAARAAVLPDHIGAKGVSAAAMLSNLSLFPSSLEKLVLPVHLSVLAVPEDTWLWPGFLGAGLFVALFFVPKIRRAGVGLAAICFAAFIVPGIPASNLLVLENRLYLPALGIVLLACEVASCVAWSARVKLVTGGIVIAGLAAMSFAYAGNFSDRLTFHQAAVRMSPHASLAHRNLGVTLHAAGDENAAWREYEAALAEDSGEPVAHNNMAVILMAHGRLAEAEPHLRQELAIQPTYLPAHRNLALVLRGLGRQEEAAVHWQSILDLGARGSGSN